MFVRGTNTLGPVFFSLSTNSSGNKRQWSDAFPLDAADSTKFKTGDYSKGGFYFVAATKQLRYWVQWIETTSNTGNTCENLIIACISMTRRRGFASYTMYDGFLAPWETSTHCGRSTSISVRGRRD